MKHKLSLSVAGISAGLVSGLLGAGGGSILAPMLGKHAGISEEERFPSCTAIMVPICIVSLLFSANWQVSFRHVIPYLLGSIAGGIASGHWGGKIPAPWLHRIFGLLMLWGGWQILW